MSNVGPQLVRQVVRVALWSRLETARSSCACKAALPSRVAARRISRRLQPGCPSVGGPLTVGVSPRMKCAGLASHELCAPWVPAPRSRISSPFKARRAVRPSAASGRPVRFATAEGLSLLERRLPWQGRPSARQSLSSCRRACDAGLSGYHRQMRAAFSPAWPWPNPSIERTFQKPLRAFWPAAHLQR